ncbi:filamentous hemagglutinin N-terminal domain-containing protein [Pseudomonas monteilii]|uniref:two-partner secretion domain-containing protein n=1 Tax=Pseudomonas monteilii TaxID=76759 RepID=UPI0018ABAEB8|nr:filamentous hemagglutinin N-terminal domain-containing protein [Pseudomonas monteilii]MBF8745845.1 filamentous hemagglutinin N-terminal domain-containing protein [Pseudomonas monteilii]
MDVRQFAFLARQPSAALQHRQTFWGLSKRGLAFMLANMMFWHPLVAMADGIKVNGSGTTVGQAGNGVPIVNIAKPNGSGLSHNKFSDYNVGQQGVILNNATERTQSTQLGGIIIGNSNLGGRAASTILNEVNGGNPSQLKGYTEVAGKSAHVIVANPYGVTCNGCGFINTPKATLTTGKPVIENGQLQRYQVEQGSVAIEGAGLNANNVDQFEIITRSAKINAEIQARNLAVVAGSNDVDARTLAATPRAGDPSQAPQLAIDSSALGGMYANTIKLVGTEAGVGVKLDGKLIASGGDIQLDANGQLRMAEATATKGSVAINAGQLDAQGAVYAGNELKVRTRGDLNNRQTLAAGQRISLDSGGRLSNQGIIEAGINADNSRNTTGDVRLNAQHVDNQGNTVVASRDLNVTAQQTLNNQGGTLSAKRQLTASANTLDNRNAGRLLSGGQADLAGARLLNGQGGLIDGATVVNAKVGQLDNAAGTVRAGQHLGLTASGAVDNRAGQLTSLKTLDLKAGQVSNGDAGRIASNQALTANVTGLDQSNGGRLTSVSELSLTLNKGHLNNQGGLINAPRLTLNELDSVDNRQGEISSAQAFVLIARSLDNSFGKLLGNQSLTLHLDQALNNEGGVISATGLDVRAASLDNRQQGLLSSLADLSYNGMQLDNRGGLLSAGGPVRLQADSLDNSGGRISSQRALVAELGRIINQGGELVAQGDLLLTGTHLDNRGNGLVGGTSALQLNVAEVDNRGGEISTSKGLTLQGSRLDNSDSGKVLAGTTLQVQVAEVLNRNLGLLSATGPMSIVGQRLDNQQGRLFSGEDLDIRLGGGLANLQGLISAEGHLTANLGRLDNLQGGQLVSGEGLELTAGQVNNGQGSRIASEKALVASVSGLTQDGGELFSKAALTLDLNHGVLSNRQGLINGPLLVLKNLAEVDNQQGEISSDQSFTLAARSLDNRNGRLIAGQGLTLRIDQLLNNLKGLVSADALDLHGASLDNRQGLISSRADQVLVVAGELLNQGGTLIADRRLDVRAGSLVNQQGQVSAGTELSAQVGNLDNQAGVLVSTGAVALSGDTLDNRQGGLVGATHNLDLQFAAVDNRAGELSSKADVTLGGTRLDNSDAGKVLADGSLQMAVAEVINRSKGVLSGQAGLRMRGDSLDNTGGLLLSQHAIDTRLQGKLDNRQGLISAEGTLSLASGELDNRAGSVSSAGVLTLEHTGNLLNQGGELVTDAALHLRAAQVANTDQGIISAKGLASIEASSLDNSRKGRIDSGASLDLATGQLSNRDGGRIASDGALAVNATGLDQQGGQLFSNSALTLDLNHGLLDNRQGLINAPLLVLDNLGEVNNQGGEISSAQAFTLAARSLDNGSGKVLSNQSLTLRIAQALNTIKGLVAAESLDIHAASLDNSGGTLSSRGGLDLQVLDRLNNGQQGLINAAGLLDIAARSVDNQAGSLLGNTIRFDFGSATGDLNNDGGLITTAGALTFDHLRDLSNRSGEISTQQSLDLSGRDLDNSAGKLISSGQLHVTAQRLLNQGGLVSGWQGLGADLGSLDNRNQGTLSSRSGALDVQVSGELQNSAGGALVSQQALSVSAANLDNSGAGILSSAGGQRLIIRGLLNNGQGGLIDSGAALTLNAMALGNGAGSISAQQALEVNANSLDNSAGSLIGNAAVTLKLLGALTNVNGKLASAGPLRIDATQVGNQGGQIASQGLLSLFASSLDNRNRGTVAANQQLTLAVDGELHNGADGLIYSQNGGLDVRAASLGNAKGTLQSQGALVLVTGDIDNQSGRLLADAGDLGVTAGNLDNRGGVLSSLQGTLNADLRGVLKNGYDLNNNRQGGITQAQSLTLKALAGIDNYGGRISAQAGDALVTTADFDNRNGGLYAQGLVKVSGGSFDNSGDNDGQIAGQRIDLDLSGALNNRLGIIESDSTLAISAASLDNQTGQLRALGSGGTTRLQIGGQFDNRNGTLETANSDLSLGVGSFLNAGGNLLHVGNGNFAISTANVTGAGGSIVTRGGLTLNASSWSNSNVIQAGRLSVNVGDFSQTASGQLLASEGLVGSGGNWSNDGLIASDGSLSLDLTGTYAGNGRLSSRGTLGLGAGQVNLGSTGSIAGGGATRVTVAGQLNNAGRLTSAAGLTLGAGGVSNQGTLGAGEALTLTTGALLNSDGGLIFSGQDMGLRVASLTNSYADVYSLGRLSIDRDGLGGLANSIVNSSGSLQSDLSMSLAASTIQNVRAVLQTDDKGLYTARVGEVACIEGYNAGDCSGKRNHVWEIVQRDKFEVIDASAASSITTGGNLTIHGGDLLNSSSTIGAGGNLVATVDNLTNTGVETGETETTRIVRSQRTNNAGSLYQLASSITNKYWFESAGYDPANLGGLEADLAQFIGKTEAELVSLGSTRKLSSGDQRYAAVMQANGAVSITTGNGIDNSVVRPGYAYIGSGARTDTTAPGTAFSTRITLNQQLPPDLAQQQVNPLALPGFSLPTGQNGLFRLSSEAGSTSASGPQSWSIGGASLGLAQRQQPLPLVEGRDIRAADASLATASSTALSTAERTQAASAGPASAVDTRLGAEESITQATVLNGQGPLTIERVQGLPDSSVRSNPHKYLIETNPVLTDLKQFMSSDYLLENLGYDPDDSAKRLGDGFYEQKLIQQAVLARTGQRFIDGQSSDEQLFKYLMDNAIQSKQQLDLAVGVSLTSEQVAALTHDIVWLETAEVNGEQVLVPVLYLAHGTDRLAPNGALIAGNDVSLIAGQNLDNVGTLRASNNLSAQAGNDLINSGLVQAGNRLDLLAGNDLVNKAGGIIAGRDVSLTAVQDVINERTLTSHQSSNGSYAQQRDFVDTASRVEAANDLVIKAGRDLDNNGGVLSSGADTTLQAGRDVKLTSVEQVVINDRGVRHTDSSVTQNGSSVQAGRDLTVSAGRDVSAVASAIEAKRDVVMSATENINLVSAADETHSASKTKKVTSQEDHVSQVATTVTAGGDVVLASGADLNLVSSRVTAGDEAYLVADGQLNLLAQQDSDYSLYDMKKKGDWGSKKTQRDEVTQLTHVGSEVHAGGNLTLKSEGDQTYQVAKLESGKDLTLESGGGITFEGVKDLHQESHEKSKGDLAWNSMKGKGSTDETLRQSQLLAQGALTIKAVEGLKVDLKHIDQKTVSQTIDAMVEADPQLAWLKDAEARGDVDWRRVQEVHDSWKYSHSGLGAGAQIVIAIVVTYLTAGAASAALGTAAGATAGSGTAMAASGTASLSAIAGGATAGSTVAAGWANVALTAVASGAASTATISTINNRGNLGLVVKDVTSSDALRGYAVSGITAGLTTGVFDGWTNTTTNVEGALPNAGKVVAEGGLSSLQGIGRFGVNQLLQNGTSTVLDKALGGDSQFDNALRSSLANTFAAAGFNWVGDVGKQFGLADGGAAKIGLHAVMGGLAAEASGGDFKSGALAAGLNEAVVDELAKQYESMPLEQKQKLLAMNSQLIGAFAAAAGGGDGKDLQTGAWAAQNSTLYNRQLHPNEVEFASDKDRVRRFAAENGLTEDQAQQELLRTAAAMVDRGWNSVLTDGNTVRAADYLRTELSQFKDDTLFQVSLADYNNERVGLIELFQDKTALKKMLDNVALVDPLDYRTDVKYMREVLNAKGQGSQEGLASALEGMASGPSKAVLWAIGAANCPSCAANDVADAWNAALELPTELRLKGYLDNLHIMQGSGAEVIQSESASSTELGVGIGVAIGGGLGGGKTALPGAKGGDKILWGSWKDYLKVSEGGKTYAQIGDRLYTEHAVNRMQPSGLGAPAGEKVPGRNVSPNLVDDVIRSGQPVHTVVDGVPRTVYWSGNVGVVTENSGKLVVTILRRASE